MVTEVQRMSTLSAGESVSSNSLEGGRVWRTPDVTGIALLSVTRVAIGLAGLYTVITLYGVVAGYALPTATVFHIVPHPGFITRIEDYLASTMLLLALAGAGFAWARYYRLIRTGSSRNQIMTLRLLYRSGFFLVVAAVVLVESGAWSGLVLGGSVMYPSIGGLVPHSDASGYFVTPPQQAITGAWGYFSSRRPLAAAFRELIMGLAGLSYVWTLLVQAILVSAACYAAVRSVALWRGVWCALAFSAFFFVLVRPFIATTLTEPLGLFWGLLSVMFFVESMRANSRSVNHDSKRFAFLALVTLTLGEMTRMGSMFTIPAFVLWISLAFSSTVRGRAKLFAISSGLVILVIGVQALLSALYGSASTVVGGNFAFVLCGLTVGGEWTTCPQIYAQDFGRLTSEREQVAFLYAKAFEVAAHDPRPMLGQMYKNIINLITNLPGFMMFSYLRVRNFPWWPLIVLLPGLWWALWYRRKGHELLFWVLIFGSIALSTAIVYGDDGWRVFYTTWPFVALFLSLGFASPCVVRVQRQVKRTSVRCGAAGVTILVALMIAAPVATRMLYGRTLAAVATTNLGPQEAILAGATLTGFAVIPDSAPFPEDIPAMHVSDFRRVVDDKGLKNDFGKFVDSAVEQVPFAFVTAARVNGAAEQPEQVYVAPVQILSEPSAMAWRVLLNQETPSPILYKISSYRRIDRPPSPTEQQTQ